MRCHLVAVQADMRFEHYLDPERFRSRMVALASAAVAGLDDAPRVVAFPEAIGLPLLFGFGAAVTASSAAGALVRRGLRDPGALLKAAWRHRRFGPGALYLPQAAEAHAAYVAAFAEAARVARATVIAGSIFLPQVEREAARGLHVSDSRVRNVAYTFSPEGRILSRTPKVHLTPGAERRAGLSPAPYLALQAVMTEVGPLGVAICLDAFYPTVIERYDAQGAWLLVQPSANHAAWDRPWPPEPSLREGEAWLERGLRAQLQGRTNLRYGLNPMLVGEVLDLRPRGRSSIVANVRHHPDASCEGLPGLLAIAVSSDREEFVRAEVDSG